jgi:REP element-mobilizing transposase RayT
MSCAYFLKYKTAGGWDAFFNPESISHIYPKCGFIIVTMTNGYEFTFDSTVEDFLERIRKDIAEATRTL